MDEREESSDDESGSSVASSNYRFELHELIFAEQLGIDLDEEYAGELVKVAAKALYVLPEGWEIQFTTTQQGQVPYYYDSNLSISHWAHPFLSDFQLVVAERRQELMEGDDEEDEEEEDSEEEDEEEVVILEPQTEPKKPADPLPYFEMGVEKDPPVAHNPLEVVDEVKEDASSVATRPLDTDTVSALSEDISVKSYPSPRFTPSGSVAMSETKVEEIVDRESFESAISDEVAKLEQALEAVADIKPSTDAVLDAEQAVVPSSAEIKKTASKDSVNSTQSKKGSGSVKASPKGAGKTAFANKSTKTGSSLKVPSADHDDQSVSGLSVDGATDLDDNKSVGSIKSVRSTASVKTLKSKTDNSNKSAVSMALTMAAKKDTAVGSTASSKNEKVIVPSSSKKHSSVPEKGAGIAKTVSIDKGNDDAASSLFDAFFEMNDTMAGLIQSYTEEVETVPVAENTTTKLQSIPDTANLDKKPVPGNANVDKTKDVKENTVKVADISVETKEPPLQVEVLSAPPTPAEESRPYSSTPLPCQTQDNSAEAREELQSRPPVDILNDKRFLSTPGQLDKSIDIKDHFTNMFRVFAADSQNSSVPQSAASSRAGSAARQTTASPSGGTVSNLRKIVSTNRRKDGSPTRERMPTASTSQAAATAIAVANFASPSAKGRKKKRRSPKKSSSPNKSGWNVLGAYDTYTQAEKAVHAFESIYPIISSVSKTFPCTKKLPPIGSPNEHMSTVSLRASFASVGSESISSDMDSSAGRSSALLERGTIDRKAIKFAMDRPLPVIRIVRDLSRMQWLVESSDGSIKPLFVKQTKQQSSSMLPSVKLTKNENGEPQKIFAATFQPNSVFSNKNSKHVSNMVPVVYSQPSFASLDAPSSSHGKYDTFDGNNSLGKSESSSLTGSIFQNRMSSNNHDPILPPHLGPAPSSANNSISVRSIRQLLQQQRPRSNLK